MNCNPRHILTRASIPFILVLVPFLGHGQDFQLRVNGLELAASKIPDHVTLPQRVQKFAIKKAIADPSPTTYVVQIGEEEHSFRSDGTYHEVEFSHDVRELAVYILNEKRQVQGRAFVLRKPR